jgi:hypothetical protein
MNEPTNNSKMLRLLRFTVAAVIVGYFAVRLVVFVRREFDDFGIWMTVCILGLLAGVTHTLIYWEQCRKAPTSQLLLVASMTFGPCIIFYLIWYLAIMLLFLDVKQIAK